MKGLLNNNGFIKEVEIDDKEPPVLVLHTPRGLICKVDKRHNPPDMGEIGVDKYELSIRTTRPIIKNGVWHTEHILLYNKA